MSNRHVLQFRPRGDSEAMPYSPQRDLAAIYGPAMREAILGLDQVNWRPFFREWMEVGGGITQEQLAAGVHRFMEAHQLFTGDPSVKEVADAFERTGFSQVSPVVQAAIYFRLGEVITAGFLIALRDVTLQGELPPPGTEILRMVAAGRLMAERLTGTAKQIDPDETRELLEAARIENEARKLKMIQLHDAIHRRDAAAIKEAGKFYEQQARYESELYRLKRRDLWQTLRDWLVWKISPKIWPKGR